MSRVTYNSVDVGDWAWAEIGFEGNPEVRVIPRCKGVKILSTTEMGGGQLSITVHAYLIKETRKEIEDFFAGAQTSYGNGPSTLVVDGVSYTNTYLVRIVPDSSYERFATFTIEFIKSI